MVSMTEGRPPWACCVVRGPNGEWIPCPSCEAFMALPPITAKRGGVQYPIPPSHKENK